MAAVDLASTQLVWATPTAPGFEILTALSTDDSRLIGQWGSCEDPTAESGVAAIDLTTGAVAWRTVLGAASSHQDSGENRPQPPTAAKGTYVAALQAGNSTAVRGAPSAEPSLRLVAVDVQTGAERWHRDGVPTGQFNLSGDPVVYWEPRSDGGTPATLHALDRVTGTERWTTDLAAGAPILPPVQITATTVVVPRVGETVGLDATTGDQRWTNQLAVVPSAAPTGRFIVGIEQSPSSPSSLVGLDAATGALRWRRPQPAPGGAVELGDSWLVLRSAVPESDNGTRLTVIDPASGQDRWHRDRSGTQQLFVGHGQLLAIPTDPAHGPATLFALGTGAVTAEADLADGLLPADAGAPKLAPNARLIVPRGCPGGP